MEYWKAKGMCDIKFVTDISICYVIYWYLVSINIK